MILCITTVSAAEALVDERFGRAGAFTFVDTETDERRVVPNDFAGGASGVGAQVAQFIAAEGTEALVTGRVGPSAFRVLEAAEIPAYTTDARTVEEALDAFRAGRLEPAAGPAEARHRGAGG